MIATFSRNSEIRYRIKEIETAFNAVVPGQAASTNVGDTAPPHFPRFTIQSGNKQINISQINAQLNLDFSEKAFAPIAALPIAGKNLLKFWEGVCSLIELEQIQELGIIFTVNIPSKLNTAENGEQIKERYLKTPDWGPVASAAINIGHFNPESKLFNNLNIGLYEQRSFKVEGKIGTPVFLDVSKAPLEESGFEIRFDVNSKPLRQNGTGHTRDSGPQMLKEIEDLVGNRGAEFLVWKTE